MTRRVQLLALGNVVVLLLGIVGVATHSSGSKAQGSHDPSRPIVLPAESPSPSAAPTSQATSAAPSPSPSPAATSPSPAPVPTLTWKACEGSGFECATLPVPLDPDHPDGETIPLALIRLPASDPAHRIGSLVVNPGGPGASGYDFVRDSAPLIFSASVRRVYDLVGFDPRGVDRSDGVHCVSGAQLDALFHTDPAPQTTQARQDYDAKTEAFVQGCEARSAKLLAHVGTVEAAGDIDRIRQALHQKTISYFGYSYGTYLGATWADLYPGTVHAAVLDGALDPGLSLDAFVEGQAKAFDAELDRFFTWCDETASCEFRVAGSPSAQRYDALAARIHKTPLKVGTRSLGFGELQYGVGEGMYSRALWPQLGTSLAQLAAGDGSGLLGMSDDYLSRGPGGTYDDSFEANTAINCLDHQGPRSEQGWYDAAQATAKEAPRLGFSIVYTTLACASWPVPARAAHVPHAVGAPPIVVVGGVHDPATPYAWAQQLSRDLTGSRLITRAHDGSGDGHTSYGPASPCTTSLVDAYLLKGTLPAVGATC